MFAMKFSRLFSAAIASLAVLCATVAYSAPDVVFGNLGSTGLDALSNTNYGVTDTAWLAQGFTVGGTNTTLKSVSLGLFDANSTNVRLQVFASGTAGPTGTALGTVSQNVLGTTPTLQTFVFSPNLSLTSGSSYWIVASTLESSGLFSWAFNSAGDFGTQQNTSGWSAVTNQTRLSTNSGATWANSGADRPAGFSIQAVPEPSTYALAGIGVAAAGLMRWRRRKAGR
jgi:hypothetical protein